MEQQQEKTSIYKLVNRQWKVLPEKGDDVFIRDPKLKEGHLGNLNNKTVLELEEVLARQERTLNNKYLLSKLKDGGESLRKRREEVAQGLQAARQRETPAVNGENVVDINAMEWRGYTEDARGNSRKLRENLDSDDDDDDECGEQLHPLRLMAYHSSSVKRQAGGGASLEEVDPAEAIAQELQRLALSDASNTTTAAPPTPPQDTTTTAPSTPTQDTLTTTPSSPRHDSPLTTASSTPRHDSPLTTAPSTPRHDSPLTTAPSTPRHDSFTTAPSTPVHNPTPTSTHTPPHNTSAVTPPSTPLDFGAKRIQMMEEKQRKNKLKREPFKPFRPCSNPQPLPDMLPRTRPAPDRSAICLPQEESVRLEQQSVLKEKRQMATQQLTNMRIRATATPSLRYHDTNLSHHLLDPDLDDDEWMEEAYSTVALPGTDDDYAADHLVTIGPPE